MRQIGLTPTQKALLVFIEHYVAENDGVSPSFDEMRKALGLASKSGIFRIINALSERGFIRRLPNRARSIVPISNLPQAGVFVDLSEDQIYRLRQLAQLRGQSPSAVARSFLIRELAPWSAA